MTPSGSGSELTPAKLVAFFRSEKSFNIDADGVSAFLGHCLLQEIRRSRMTAQ